MAYIPPTIAGYNATPPSDDGASTSSNRVYWATIKTKLTDPLKNYVDSINAAISTSFSGLFLSSVDDKSVNFTVGTGDDGLLFNCTSSLTATLPPASSATEGYHICILNSSSGTITIDGDGSETINGSSNMTLIDTYTAAFLVCTGSGWLAMKFGLSTDGNMTVTGKLKLPTSGELTIATGAVTATGSYHTIDTEGDAASDNLDTISGGIDGMLLQIRASNDSRDVVIKHNTGNIYNPTLADITLSTQYQNVTLKYDGALTKWIVTSGPVQLASDTVAGLVEKATQSEIEAETSDKYPDASLLKYHPAMPKAWVNFNGTGTVAIRASYNVSSITDNGTGNYTVNLTTSISSVNYCVIANYTQGTTGATSGWQAKITDYAAGSFRISTGADGTTVGTLTDAAIVTAVVFGDI